MRACGCNIRNENFLVGLKAVVINLKRQL